MPTLPSIHLQQKRLFIGCSQYKPDKVIGADTLFAYKQAGCAVDVDATIIISSGFVPKAANSVLCKSIPIARQVLCPQQE